MRSRKNPRGPGPGNLLITSFDIAKQGVFCSWIMMNKIWPIKGTDIYECVCNLFILRSKKRDTPFISPWLFWGLRAARPGDDHILKSKGFLMFGSTEVDVMSGITWRLKGQKWPRRWHEWKLFPGKRRVATSTTRAALLWQHRDHAVDTGLNFIISPSAHYVRSHWSSYSTITEVQVKW